MEEKNKSLVTGGETEKPTIEVQMLEHRISMLEKQQDLGEEFNQKLYDSITDIKLKVTNEMTALKVKLNILFAGGVAVLGMIISKTL